jgi:outer membrane lipoprotein-sorting protein
MKHLFTACCFLSLVLPAAVLQAESAAAILSRMDQAAPGFQAMSANVRLTTYTATIDDKTVEDGTLVMQRLKKNGSVRAILDFRQQKDARVIAFLGNIVRMYWPKTQFYQDYDFGKNNNLMDQLLLLGFGSSGKELAAGYDITAEGTENLGGQDTTKLLLIPKSASVKEKLLKIEIWIPAHAAYQIQQRFYQPANNYLLAVYNGIDFKPVIKGKQLDFKPPPGAKKGS